MASTGVQSAGVVANVGHSLQKLKKKKVYIGLEQKIPNLRTTGSVSFTFNPFTTDDVISCLLTTSNLTDKSIMSWSFTVYTCSKCLCLHIQIAASVYSDFTCLYTN